jgi:thiamine-phosphate pyrophosphorylase
MVITATPRSADPREVVRAVLRGGATAVQLRWKDATTRLLLGLARELRDITAETGALLIINDRVDVALVVGADGAHLGDDDLPLDVARDIVPKGFLLGRSVDNLEEAAAAEAMGADYLGLGPIFPTPSKADTGPVVGMNGITAVRGGTRIPIVAIGGIDVHTAAAAARAGADGIAVIGAIANAPDPEAMARALRKEIALAASPGPS